MPRQANSFKHLLNKFPEIELPVTLNAETHHIFSRENDPLPEGLIREYLQIDTHGEYDDLTEFVACFRIPSPPAYTALVYWKAQLMEYSYWLMTFEPNGRPIGSKVIAGTKSNGTTILTRIATIDEEGIIHIAEGINDANDRLYNAQNSQTYQLEITDTGDILHMLEEH